MSSELKKASVGPAFAGGILALLLFAVIVLVLHLRGTSGEFDSKRAEARIEKLKALQDENDKKLSSYAWVNKDKGIVQLPIARAEELVVAELRAKPVQSSTVPVEIPYPAGLQQAPAAPAAPAAGASPAPAAPATSPAQ